MIRRQIQFEEAQYETIRSLAQRHRISISEAVRRLVEEGLGSPGQGEQRTPDAAILMELAAVGASGEPDLGRRHDDYLDEAFE